MENNTLFVNGVAKVIIEPADEETPPPKSQQEGLENEHNIATDMSMNNPEMTDASVTEAAADGRRGEASEMEASAMMTQSIVEDADFGGRVTQNENIPEESVKIVDTVMTSEAGAPSDILSSPAKHSEMQAVETETDFLTSGDVKQPEDNMIMQEQDITAAAGAACEIKDATVLEHQSEAGVAEEEYINLDNFDLSNLNLPPGNYNLVIDEQGQAVFVPTDVIDENTIQVVAQE